MTLPSVYRPAEVEARWYPQWESRGYFKPASTSTHGPFTIVIPPPNVTGILHMGHALNNTLQDILIRFRRMQGYAALWVPGTDHAGIATQNVVERQLAQEGISRQQLGREEFLKRVWAWKEQYGSTIVGQLRRLGASCDWSRERFTMDPGLSKSVETAFMKLYEAGLIYRGYYLVNWCPRCQTALSDEEVQHEEVKGHLYYIRYPWQSQGAVPLVPPEMRDGVVVATTRPETLLGDVAVAIHPEDERYRKLTHQKLLLPILKRPLLWIQDPVVDRQFGTGAVKVTPAHDPVDFLLGQKHGLQAIRVMTPDGRMNDQAGPYAGLDRFECRKRILEDLASQGLLVKTEEHATSIGHCYRCKTIIEPTLSPQWFVRMKPLAQLGIEAVEKDGMRFIPERWVKVYLDWLKNIRDWCISRQIWWGHRIPAWYCSGCYPAYVKAQQAGSLAAQLQMDPQAAGIHVGVSAPSQCRRCGNRSLTQDEDVLDTWFSSWLWPFSTLGWPEETQDLKRFYPTSVLVTGQDILFFWVARMVMAGKFFMKEIPFRDVTIHGIIRVEGGKKMSKSLGNIIDPIEVIERTGADALRFSIAHMTSEGQDLYLSEGKFLLGRNFTNKLWNAARLILIGDSLRGGRSAKQGVPLGTVPEVDTWSFNPRTLTLADRWILSRLQQVVKEVTQALQGYHVNVAAKSLYQFLWHEFCDWYLEIAKLQREEGDPIVVHNSNHILLTVLKNILKLLHPLMPFVTEELWQKIQHPVPSSQSPASGSQTPAEEETMMKAPWPEPIAAWIDPQAEAAFARLASVITGVRNLRSTFRVPVKERVTLIVRGKRGLELLTQHEKVIQRLASVKEMTLQAQGPRPVGSVVSHISSSDGFDAWDLVVPLQGLVDLDVERRRIQNEIRALRERMEAKRKRLSDSTFRAKAPSEVVAEEEESLKELETELARWTESLKQL